MSKKWKNFDLTQSVPKYFDNDICQTCFYAMEYSAHLGYGYSDENQLIFNFKKEPRKRNTGEWRHKERAIQQFAESVNSLLNRNQCFITTMPTSKKKEHENYDSRLDDMINKLLQLGKGAYQCVYPITLHESMLSASMENGTRDPDKIYKNYKWQGFKDKIPSRLIIIDDVVTTGAHFTAYRKMVLENCPDIKLYGVFWAKTI